jgi:NADH-ubiquinone oxidoreductase chain 4
MIFLFLFTLANIGTPGLSLNWIGEFLSLMGLLSRNYYVTLLAMSRLILRACFSIWLFNRLAFGRWSYYLNYTKDLNRREFFVLFSYFIPTLFFGLMPNSIIETLHFSVRNLIFYLT